MSQLDICLFLSTAMAGNPFSPNANTPSKGLPFSHYPPGQRAELWAIAEDDFFRAKSDMNHKWLTDAQQRWQHERSAILGRIHSHDAEARYLKEKEDTLTREVVSVQSQDAIVREKRERENRRLEELDSLYAKEMEEFVKKEESGAVNMHDYFNKKRQQDGLQERPQPPRPQMPPTGPLQQSALPRLPPIASLDLPPPHRPNAVTLVDRSGGRGFKRELIGQRVSARLDDMPVLRLLRPSDDALLPKIVAHLNNDQGNSATVAALTQAKGQMKTKPCMACKREPYPFEGCVVVAGSDFSKCANCEWNNRTCLGYSPEIAASMLPTPTTLSPDTSDRLISRALAAMPDADAALGPDDGFSSRPYDDAIKSPYSTSPTGFRAINNRPAAVELPSPASPTSPPTPPQSGRAPSSSELPLRPAVPSVLQPTQEGRESEAQAQVRLLIHHRNGVYTHPKCLEGVPVDRIHSAHQYWDNTWPDLRIMVLRGIEKFKKRHAELVQIEKRDGLQLNSAKYQAGRQVNRGKAMLDFLNNGPISPYQLLSKRYMRTGKGSITSYDTLFRLCDTIMCLPLYGIDIDPVDWLRLRLNELIEEQGATFNFSKTLHDFYNDRKLRALRIKSGFKSIGRPAGSKMKPKGEKARERSSSVNDTPGSRKRKSSDVDCDMLDSMEVDLPPSPAISADSIKKQKAASVLDSLETDEVSDTDSLSGARIDHTEFRVYQVKTRVFTSSESVTQYFSFVADRDMFEHHVLKETHPLEWAVHRRPIDFSLCLDDIVKVFWNLRALRICIVLNDEQTCSVDNRPRGDMMVSFKRENTMRRFLNFCRRRDFELVEDT